jgi:hypothetical protein
VRYISQASHGRSRSAFAALHLLASVVVSLPISAAAHDVLTNFVQHNVRLTMGARHLDVTIDLTFFEEWSARERQAMDADANGRVTRAELEAYLKKLAPELAQLVGLRIAGHELPLVQLYDPEIDLLGSETTGPAHHRLRLYYFVSTPSTLRSGDVIIIEDRLWPEAKALVMLQADGHDGCALQTETPDDPGFVSAQSGGVRLCKFRCSKPPQKQAVPKIQ